MGFTASCAHGRDSKYTGKFAQLRTMTHPLDDCHEPRDVISRIRRRVDIHLGLCVQQSVLATVRIFVAGGKVFCRLPLDFYHIFSLGGQVARFGQCGVGRGDRWPEGRRTRLTEIVEMILSARDVGGFPPPIGLYAGGWTRLLRGADRERGCGGSESAGVSHADGTQAEGRTKLR